LEKRGFFDTSTCNSAIYKAEWTGLHDLGLMYGMQAFGILNVKDIQANFKMFEHMTLSAMTTRCYRLLCVSSVAIINQF